MITWFALVIALGQGSPDAVVTMNVPAVRVCNFMPVLGKAVGKRLVADATVANEVLVLDVRDVSSSDLLKQIAAVLDATWLPTESGMVLKRSRQDIVRIQTREAQSRARQAEAFLKPIKEKAATLNFKARAEAEAFSRQYFALARLIMGPKQKREEVHKFDNASTVTPSRMLFRKLLAAMPPEWIGSVDRNRRVVFSSRPTLMQRPLPNASKQVIADFLVEQQAWSAAYNEFKPLLKQFRGTGRKVGYVELGPQPLILLAVRRDFEGYLDVQGYVVDEKGERHELSEYSVDEPEHKANAAERIQFGPLSETYLRARRLLKGNQADEGKRLIHEPKMLAFLSRPDESDPLQLVVTDGLRAIGRERNLVANPNDELLVKSLKRAMQENSFSLKSFQECLAETSHEVTEEGGWMLVKQQMPFVSEKVDREALAKLLAAGIRRQRVTLDELAAFAATLDGLDETLIQDLGPFDTNVSGFYLYPLVSGLERSYDCYTFPMLRFYGLLTQEQKAALIQGRSLEFSSLSEAQRQPLLKALFNRELEGVPSVEDTVWAFQEPTIALRNGIPGQARLSAGLSLQDTYFASSSLEAEVGPRPVDVYEIASSIAWTEAKADGIHFPRLDQFWLGSVARLSLYFTYAPDRSMAAAILEMRFDAGAKPMAFKDLPEKFRLEVEEKTAQSREGIKGLLPMRSVGPPPP